MFLLCIAITGIRGWSWSPSQCQLLSDPSSAGGDELCTVLPLRDGWQHFKWTVQNNLNQREDISLCIVTALKMCMQFLPVPCSAGTTWDVQQTCSAERCCNAVLAPGPSFLSYLKWSHCKPGRIKAVLFSLAVTSSRCNSTSGLQTWRLNDPIPQTSWWE